MKHVRETLPIHQNCKHYRPVAQQILVILLAVASRIVITLFDLHNLNSVKLHDNSLRNCQFPSDKPMRPKQNFFTCYEVNMKSDFHE